MKRESFAQKLSEILEKQGTWPHDRAQAAQKLFRDRSAQSFVTFLIEENLISRAELLNALSEYYQVPAFDVSGYFFDHELLTKFPKDVLLRNVMIPLEVDRNMLIMVVGDPNNPDLLSTIGDFVSYDVRFQVGLEQDITDAVKEFYDLAPTQVAQDIDIGKEQREHEEAENIIWQEEED